MISKKSIARKENRKVKSILQNLSSSTINYVPSVSEDDSNNDSDNVQPSITTLGENRMESFEELRSIDLTNNEINFDTLLEDLFNEKEKDYEVPLPDPPQLSLAEQLLLFYVMFNLPFRTMAYLLQILNKCNVSGVPKSMYLLKKVGKCDSAFESFIKSDHLAYLSIASNLEYAFQLIPEIFCANEKPSQILPQIKINIDGLPLFRSSSVGLWTILMQIKGLKNPLPLGVYCGIGKPNLSLFLENMTTEFKQLKSYGIYLGNKLWQLGSIIFVCDAPARSFIMSVASHSGYNGCMYCRQRGEYYHERIVFPSDNYDPTAKRTNEFYASNLENNMLAEKSPLLGIVQFPDSFVPDSMHLVYLGVTKKLLNCYFTSIKGFRLSCKLPKQVLQSIDSKIKALQHCIPCDFQRKIRSTSELCHYKASEYRSWLLYLGPFVLCNKLKEEYYQHFLLLHMAMYILSSKRLFHLKPYAKTMIELFVVSIEKLFDRCFYSFNFHCLLHLPDYLEGSITADEISAFPFENYLSLLKRRIRATSGIFKQSLNQLIAVRDLYSSDSISSCLINVKFPDNIVMTYDLRVLLVTHISTCKKNVSGIYLSITRDLYTYHTEDGHSYPSRMLGIGYYQKTIIKANNVPFLTKCIGIPISASEYVIIPYC